MRHSHRTRARLLALAFITPLICIPWIAADAQFNLPIPLVLPTEQVVRLDIQNTFGLVYGGNDSAKRRSRLDSIVPGNDNRLTAPPGATRDAEKARQHATYDSLVNQFCADERLPEQSCKAALAETAMRARLTRDNLALYVESKRYFGGSFWPGRATSRVSVSRYLRHSGVAEDFNFATQFGANVSDKEAYVTSNVVKGLVGRSIFSADYAVVVTRSTDADAKKRDVIQSDKANLLRAVNNGGTLVGRFTIPMFASAGGTAGKAAGVTASVGFLGPIQETDDAKQSAVGSASAEGVTSIALRSLSGSYDHTADLILGARAGYTQSERTLRLDGTGGKGVGFGQVMVGIRQNGSMSLAALVTLVSGGFSGLVPRLMLNYSATR